MAQFRSLTQHRPIAVRIAEQVVSRIHSGEFPVGTRLPAETELARQFGVSRPSVREALGALQFVGYIDSVRGSGTRVISRSADHSHTTIEITPAQILSLFQARLLLEPQVAAMAARDPDLSRLERAEELIEAMGLVVHEPALHGETDLAVHRIVAEVCRNEFLREPVLRLLDLAASPALKATRLHAWDDPELPLVWEGQHREIVRAIRAQDSAGAVEATWEHLASSAHHALAVASQEPDVEGTALDGLRSLLDQGPAAVATAAPRRRAQHPSSPVRPVQS